MRINDIINEGKTRLDPKCWTGKKIGNPKTKMKGGVRVNNCVPVEEQETGNVDDADSQQSLAADAARNAETVKMSRQDAAAGGVAEDGTWGMMEETYHGDEFYEAYGDMWFNEDEIIDEAEYQGRKVKLGKPMQGDVKKFKVYVRIPKATWSKSTLVIPTCVSKSPIQQGVRVSAQDTIVQIQDLAIRPDIGAAASGKKIIYADFSYKYLFTGVYREKISSISICSIAGWLPNNCHKHRTKQLHTKVCSRLSKMRR